MPRMPDSSRPGLQEGAGVGEPRGRLPLPRTPSPQDGGPQRHIHQLLEGCKHKQFLEPLAVPGQH